MYIVYLLILKTKEEKYTYTHTLTLHFKSYFYSYSPMHDKSDRLDILFLIFYDKRFGFFPPPPWKKTCLLSFRVAFAGNLSFWTFFFPTNFHVTTWLPFSFVTLFNGGVAWHKRNLKFGLSAHDIRGEREAVLSLIHDGELCKKWFFNAQTSSRQSGTHI